MESNQPASLIPDNLLGNITDRLLSGHKIKPPTAGTYQPTLVLGLGGTGVRIVRQLKTLLADHQATAIHLLAIDADNSENEKWASEFMPLERPDELLVLDPAPALGALARAAKRGRTDTHILDYLPDQHGELKGLHAEAHTRVRDGKGAGQVRRFGRLLFNANVSEGANVKGRLTQLCQEMLNTQAVFDQVARGAQVDNTQRIFVCSSLAGGTGAGCLLDALALLRLVFGTNAQITLLAVLPGSSLDALLRNPALEKPNTRSNAVGLLRELEALVRREPVTKNFQFKFSSTESYVLPADLPLLEDIYLIDDKTSDGVAVHGYLDLCKSVGHFLYAFLGSGVGAVQAAGAINGQIAFDLIQEGRCFNAMGISVLDYAKADVALFQVRLSLKTWLADVLHDRPAKKPDEEVEAFLKSLLLEGGSVEAFLRPALQPAASNIEGGTFLSSAQAQKLALKDSDDIFLSRGATAREAIGGKLADSRATFENLLANYLKEKPPLINQAILRAVNVSLPHASAFVNRLRTRMDSVREAHLEQMEDNSARRAKLENELAKLAKTIRRWPGAWLEQGARRNFIARTVEYLQVSIDLEGDRYVLTALDHLLASVDSEKASFDAFFRELQSLEQENQRMIEKTTARPVTDGYLQLAMPRSEWMKFARLNSPKPTALTRLDTRHAISQLVEALLPALEQWLDAEVAIGSRLLAESRKGGRDGGIAARLRGIDNISQPLFQMVRDHPPVNELNPQKFVAAFFNNNAYTELIRNCFQAPPGRQHPTTVEHFNPSVAICITTLHGLSFQHWQGFADAEAFYQKQPWRYHAVFNPADMPRLRSLDTNEVDCHRLFGLALMFGAIEQRGSNYYVNLDADPADSSGRTLRFLTYKKERPQAAAVLVELELVVEAKKSSLRPDQARLLGNSLEAAHVAFPSHLAFYKAVGELVADFSAISGAAKLAEMIREHANGRLVGDVKKATAGSPRRLLLEAIQDELLRHAADLERK